MMITSFRPQELYCMAVLQGKHTMYGIPNGMGSHPRETALKTLDEMLAKQVASMDLDGRISLAPEYAHLTAFYCDCQKCLTVNFQEPEGETQNLIFWQYHGKYQMARFIQGRYVFFETTPAVIRDLLGQMIFRECHPQTVSPAIIPHNQLLQAKRLCLGEQVADGIRLLRQQGASEELAKVIADGLLEQAYALNLLSMEQTPGGCQQTELAYLSSRGFLLSLEETIMNYRSCTVFTSVDPAEMDDAVHQLVERFCREEPLYV